ncbi:MAG: hypothetical protein SH809_09260 [Rhodothermales bacterium]|nr:hypothetical protein [Rhodothermales bacterium]
MLSTCYSFSRLSTACLLALCLASVPAVRAQTLPSPDIQIAGAVSPLPENLKAGATVLGYDASKALVTLREGNNEMICLADNPFDDRFQAACYAASLEPFMARGRQLVAEGADRGVSRDLRLKEIEAGTLKMPEAPAALYQLFGQADSFNLATGELTNVRPLYVMYIPYATTETTGLSTEPPMPGAPWLMDAGLPWAHIMYSPAQSGN